MKREKLVDRAIGLLKEEGSEECPVEWCPYCALATAKTEIDEEDGTGMELSEVFRQLATGIESVESDEVLESACEFVAESCGYTKEFTKESAIKYMKESRNEKETKTNT